MLTFSATYGYVVGVGCLSVLFDTYCNLKVSAARSAAAVPYPNLYASHEEASKDFKKLVFNCTQRGHQNFLENFPSFLFVLFAGGVQHPLIASFCGLIYLIGRFFYMKGYSSGDPNKRNAGNFSQIGLIALLILSFKTATAMVLSS